MLDLFRTLPRLIGDLEAAEPLRKALIFAAWRRVAGKGIADAAVPVRFEDARLAVAVVSDTWRQNLESLAPQLLFKLNAAVGELSVTYIDFETDEAAVRAVNKRASVSSEEAMAQAENSLSPEIRRAAEKIADPELRKDFLSAAAGCLFRNEPTSEARR